MDYLDRVGTLRQSQLCHYEGTHVLHLPFPCLDRLNGTAQDLRVVLESRDPGSPDTVGETHLTGISNTTIIY